MEADTIGILALCGSMVGVLCWIIKYQAKMISNHLTSIQRSLDSLPCRRGADCPVEVIE